MPTSTPSPLPNPVQPRALDRQGAASYLNTSERHVRHLAYQRKLRSVRVGRFVRYLREDLDDYLDAHAHEVAADGADLHGGPGDVR